MPHILIFGTNGETYTLDSSDQEVIQKWITETVARLVPMSQQYGAPLWIQVYPLWGIDGADWPTNMPNIQWALNKRGIQSLLNALKDAGIDVPETTGATA